jgi:PAS domain S-box-containing protein
MPAKPTYTELEQQIVELKKQVETLHLSSKKSIATVEQYQLLFENSIDGFAYCKMVFENDTPTDFIYLAVNPAFEKLTGLKDVSNRLISAIIPDVHAKNPEIFEIYGSVALTGIPQKFEIFFKPFNSWLSISAICPKKGYFIAIFDDITYQKKLEKDLQNSQKHYQQIFDNSGSGLITIDQDGKCLMINEKAANVFGLPTNNIVNKSILNLLPEPDAKKYLSLNKQLIETGGCKAYEDSFTINGKERVFSIIDQCIEGENGQRNAILSSSFDITERVLAEQALKESEEKYRHLIERMQLGMVLHGPDAEILLSNDRALDLLGLTESQLLGKTSFDPDWNVIHEDGSPFPGNTHPSVVALNTGTPINDVVMGLYRPNGKRVWLLVDAEPKLNDDGSVKEVLVLFVDITDRKRNEQLLKESEAHLRLIADNLPIISNHVGSDLKYRFVNKMYQHVVGISPIEIIGKHVQDIMGKKNFKKNVANFDLVFTGKVVSFELKVLNKEKEELIFKVTLIPEFSSNKVIGFFTLAVDVTEQKKAEKLIQKIVIEQKIILSTVSIGISHIKDRKIVWANAAHDEILGYNPGETKGLETSVFYCDIKAYNEFGKQLNEYSISDGKYTTEIQMQKKTALFFGVS